MGCVTAGYHWTTLCSQLQSQGMEPLPSAFHWLSRYMLPNLIVPFLLKMRERGWMLSQIIRSNGMASRCRTRLEVALPSGRPVSCPGAACWPKKCQHAMWHLESWRLGVVYLCGWGGGGGDTNRTSLRFKKFQIKISIVLRFIEKFSLFSKRSEALDVWGVRLYGWPNSQEK